MSEFSMCPDDGMWDRIQSSWANGAVIEFVLYDAQLDGEHPSDRLQMIVTDCDGDTRGWIMNIEDAMIIIRGLSRLVDNALRLGLPISGDYGAAQRDELI